jgi:hypothetical protein
MGLFGLDSNNPGGNSVNYYGEITFPLPAAAAGFGPAGVER